METRIFKWKLEYLLIFFKRYDSHGISYPEGLIEYQVETRIFKWKVECSSGNSNIQMETRIFKWKLEYSSGNPNIQVETRTFTLNFRLKT